MRKFNLEEALAGKPVISRDGRKVLEIKIIDTVPDSSSYKLVVHFDGGHGLYSCGIDGKFGEVDYESANDLFMGYSIEEIQLAADRYQALKNELLYTSAEFIATTRKSIRKEIYFGIELDNYADELIRTSNEPKK